MGFLASAGAFILRHMPTVISGVSSLLGRKRMARKLTKVGDNLISRGAEFLYNKLGPQGYEKAQEVLAPGVQAFRDQMNRVGAFVEQKRYPGNMIVSTLQNGAGKQYIEEQQDQMNRLSTPAHQFVGRKEREYQNRTGGPVTQGSDGRIPQGDQTNPERPQVAGDVNTGDVIMKDDTAAVAQQTSAPVQRSTIGGGRITTVLPPRNMFL